jgi:hypothetical protein
MTRCESARDVLKGEIKSFKHEESKIKDFFKYSVR